MKYLPTKCYDCSDWLHNLREVGKGVDETRLAMS